MPITIRKNGDGFLAVDEEVKAAFAEGNTKEEALENLKDVIEMINEYNKEN